MRNSIILLILLWTVFGFAETNSEKTELSLDATLHQVSKQTDIPLKKIRQYLDLDDSADLTKTLAELQISEMQLNFAVEEYNSNKHAFYGGIALVGMSIVFLSLIIVGFFIYSLQHLNHKKKPILKTVQTSVGKISASTEHISSNAIVAAIAAIYLHEAEVEEKNRLNLTWTRSQLSMWSSANMMENRFFDNKRGR
ncbi:MAG: OadG family protein [Candidatus Cloacimonadales bacterium]|nr:OadG family protein [Candidatus Cloacimonadales bacterium]